MEHHKYSAVRMTANTLEFRLFKGTMTPDSIIANAELCWSVCDFMERVSSALNPNEVQILGAMEVPSRGEWQWRAYIEFLKKKHKKFPALLKRLEAMSLLDGLTGPVEIPMNGSSYSSRLDKWLELECEE